MTESRNLGKPCFDSHH